MAGRSRKLMEAEQGVGARNRARILRAALKIFSAKGYDGTRIAEIAEQAGLPKANVYYYFPSKEAIYRAIIHDLIQGWNVALACIDPAREPADAIAAYIEAKLAYSRQHPAESKIFANEVIRGARFLSRGDIAGMQAITRAKRAVVEGWIAQGKLRPIDPRHFFILLWSATQFYAEFDPMARMALETGRLGTADYAEAAMAITNIVLRGCARP
jgi:TetR/AcrR family transcriptional regulator